MQKTYPKRPLVHYTPGKNWINDPNGCIFHEGIYHLFYQYHPGSIVWGPMHWGHAESPDLTHWEEKETALFPDNETGMVCSGSAVYDSRNSSELFPGSAGLVFLYTSHIGEGDSQLQQQCLAYSRDNGRTLEKYAHNPVVPNPGLKDFRDPKVFFHKESGKWIMVLTAGDHGKLYRSGNLLDWEEISPIRLDQAGKKGVWECPDLFPVRAENTGRLHWVFAFSLLTDEAVPAQRYSVGQFDGYRFIPYERDLLQEADSGLDFYAGQTWSGIPGAEENTTWIGWCNNWYYALKTPDGPDWRGKMTLPRKIRAVEHGEGVFLRQWPCPSLEKLRREALPDQKYQNTPCALDLRRGRTWDILFLQENESTKALGKVIFHWDTGGELELDFSPREAVLNRTHCGSLFQEEGWRLMKAPLGETRSSVFCRIILDGSVAEVFFQDGRSCITSQIFPEGRLSRMKFLPLQDNTKGRIQAFPLEKTVD